MVTTPDMSIKLIRFETEKSTHPDFEDITYPVRNVICEDGDCPFEEKAYSIQDAVEIRRDHLEWHSDGCLSE